MLEEILIATGPATTAAGIALLLVLVIHHILVAGKSTNATKHLETKHYHHGYQQPKTSQYEQHRRDGGHDPRAATAPAPNKTAELPEPPVAPASFPLLGHLVDYFKMSHAYFNVTSQLMPSPVSRLSLAGLNIALVRPAAARAVTRLPYETLSIGRAFVLKFSRSLGLGSRVCRLLEERDDESRDFLPKFHRVMEAELTAMAKVRYNVREMAPLMDEQLDVLVLPVDNKETACTDSGAATSIETHLGETIFNLLASTAGRQFWGRDGPFADPGFIEETRHFLSHLPKLNKSWSFMAPKPLRESRSRVREALDKWSVSHGITTVGTDETERQDPVVGDASCFGHVKRLCAEFGLSLDFFVDHQLILLSGLLPNATVAMNWMLLHLMARPDLLRKVQAEVDAFVATWQPSSHATNQDAPSRSEDEEAGQDADAEPHFPSQHHHYDISTAVEAACPHLVGTWWETLRFHGGFAHGRFTQTDAPIAVAEPTGKSSKFVIKKDTLILVPLKPAHFDPSIWGDDTEEFRPERFLRREETIGKEGWAIEGRATKHIRVFGIFQLRCPGRFLARRMALVGVSKILSRYDLSPALSSGETFVCPEESKAPAIGVIGPEADMRVRFTLRKSTCTA